MSNAHDAGGSGKGKQPGSVTSDLAARIARAQGRDDTETEAVAGGVQKNMSGLSRALRLGSEFTAAILVGAGIGFLLDQWLGTSPWILLVMLMVGFAAGVLNVTRAVSAMNKAAPPPPDSAIEPGDEDDDRY